MDLKIRYEHGTMIVHLEEFLSCRSIAKVRKLLKIIRSSFTPECEGQIKEFVQEQLEQFADAQKEHSVYIDGYEQKIRFAKNQVDQTKRIIAHETHELQQLQFIRDSHRKNTKVWKDCNADVKKQRDAMKEPKAALKKQKEELKWLNGLLRSRRQLYDSNVRNKEFYKKVIQLLMSERR